jgi:hypothetical protein
MEFLVSERGGTGVTGVDEPAHPPQDGGRTVVINLSKFNTRKPGETHLVAIAPCADWHGGQEWT